MRKAILIFMLTIGLCSLAFAEHETWLSIGHERAFFMDTYSISGETVDTNIFSSGANLSAYRFFGDTIGMFAHSSFLFPQKGWEWSDDGVHSLDLSDTSLNIQWGTLIGIAFRFSVFTDDLHFYTGAGFNIFFSWFFAGVDDPVLGSTFSGDMFSTSFGIGIDLGLKFDITDRFFVKLGSIVTFDFLRFSNFDIYDGKDHIENITGRDKEFFMFGVRPYIVGGVNLHWRTVDGRQRLATGRSN